ncbi:MAG: hypothetical protein IKE04_01955 [Oscillospiraceae bacterium]|nr:hypothetical protein [Oscillospiraceae bacterium]
MKRLMLVWVMILCLMLMDGLAEMEGDHMIDLNTQKAAAELQLYGYDVPESIQAEVSAGRRKMLDQLGDNPFFRAQLTREEQMRFQLLWAWGAGIYDFDTGNWTPTSDKVYAFDAEVFDIEHMYTLFLLGVQSIVPEITITDIVEDLTGMDEELDGTRSVSFLCNGHPYQMELTSMRDWIDGSSLTLMNQVLEQENCLYRLYEIQDVLDQMVILIYDTPEKAAQMKMLVDVH